MNNAIADNIGFKGKVDWIVFDVNTGKEIRSGGDHNVVATVGKSGLCSSMIGGDPFVINVMKVGTDNTTLTAADTDLGNTVNTDTALNRSSVDNVITIEGTFAFGSSFTIEEAGLFSGTTAWAFTNSISESVTTVQGLFVIWTITLT